MNYSKPIYVIFVRDFDGKDLEQPSFFDTKEELLIYVVGIDMTNKVVKIINGSLKYEYTI